PPPFQSSSRSLLLRKQPAAPFYSVSQLVVGSSILSCFAGCSGFDQKHRSGLVHMQFLTRGREMPALRLDLENNNVVGNLVGRKEIPAGWIDRNVARGLTNGGDEFAKR